MLQFNLLESERSLVEVREIFEPEIAALAALRASDVDIADLQAAVATMESHLEEANAFIEADNRFHQVLARASQNTLILDSDGSHHDALERATQTYLHR